MSRPITIIGTDRRRRCGVLALCGLTLALLLLSIDCRRAEVSTSVAKLDQASAEFDIYWPPMDPEGSLAVSFDPLLNTMLAVDATERSEGGTEIRLAITVTRPSTEQDRRRWNSKLAFADIDWMGEVRVWDADEQWLWPNLPYLLRLPGKHRVERYGGVDPGKQVDNDFAAVLIRQYDAKGLIESPETRDAPLVSAEWHAVDLPGQIDLESVVHVAKSDEFVLRLGEEDGLADGQLKVWLIYADFLGSSPPRTWPAKREWAGGILAYFEIDWQVSADGESRGLVRPKRPEESTRFDWAQWVERTPGVDQSAARVRLFNETE